MRVLAEGDPQGKHDRDDDKGPRPPQGSLDGSCVTAYMLHQRLCTGSTKPLVPWLNFLATFKKIRLLK
jgi:hypothetical protein